MDPIKLLILDNEEVYREGITRLLEEQANIEIVFHGSNSQEAIDRCASHKPDIVLIDSQISDYNAVRAVREIKECSPEAKVVILSRQDSNKNPLDFMKVGARAFLAKNISTKDLIKSLELISTGRIIISPFFAEKFFEDIGLKKSEVTSVTLGSKSLVSKREMEIAILVSQGATNKEIAEKLFITENTAKVHIKNILNKLELKNRQQLAVYAVLKEWVKNYTDRDKKDTDTTK
jgi:DNA-binding NarL/FixJ family response regulator